MKVKIENEVLIATFDTLGAELISLRSKTREYIWEGNPAFWDKQSPVLFPTIGSLKEDTYYFDGQEYHLPRHGFAREKEFQIIKHSADKIVFSLKEDAETLRVYPFNFELQIAYQLVQNKLEVSYLVRNSSQGTLLFSIGGHPGFALSENFEAYSLKFETNSDLTFSLLENHLLDEKTQLLEINNNQLPLNYALFEKDALVFKNHKIQSITIQEKGVDFVKVNFKNFPDLGIWTKINAPFICIEPWFGHADEVKTNQYLKDKAGIRILRKDEIFTSIFIVEIF